MARRWSSLLLGIAFFFGGATLAQSTRPYADEIKAFSRQDSIQAPPKRPIVFAGSSSFRLWKNMAESFPGFVILNRGFGGATLPDLRYYINEVVVRYKPKEIVIYCGENDFAAADEPSPQEVFERFKKVYSAVRSKLKKVPLVYVSMKPAPSRKHLMDKVKQGNELIQSFLAKDKYAVFVDVYSRMLNDQGLPKEDLYREDQLHMNEKGYEIWQKALLPHLKP